MLSVTIDKNMEILPVVLEGKYVRLVPMESRHLDELCSVGLDEELWRISPDQITDREKMRKYVEEAISQYERGISLPFVTIEKTSGNVVGSTRFGNIAPKDKRVEIGWTWIAKDWQRTYVNTEAKLLMLTHAFETWKCNRVEFKTDMLNERSRNAILRLGAKQEGVFRRHIVCEGGRIRDSVYFSIINDEWPDVKKGLEEKLSK